MNSRPSRTSHTALALALTITLLGPCGLAQEGPQTGSRPRAASDSGTRTFQHPLGFALSLPKGWSARDAGDGQFQITPPDARPNEAIGLTAGRVERRFAATDREAIESAAQEISRQYPQLEPRGAPQRLRTQSGDAVRLEWLGTLPDGQQARLSVYLGAVGTVAVSILAAGRAADVAARSADLETVFASLRATPAAAAAQAAQPAPRQAGLPGQLHDGSAIARDWAQRLTGRKLTLLSGYSSSGSSGGMNARHDIVLGSDGRYAYSGSSSVSMSVDGLGGSSVSQDSSEGTWRVIAQGAAAVLELATENGKQYGELTRRGTETYMGGQRVFVTDP
jgi:hypothetical protein